MQNKSLWAWTAIAMWALLAHFSGGSWPALILLAIMGYGIMKLMPDNMVALQNDRLNCLVQLIGIYLLLIQLLPMSAQYWPGKLSEKVIPGSILVLGAYSCMKKPERVAGVLFWAMVILFIPVVIAGGKDIRIEWIAPSHFGLSLWVIPVMLLPMLTRFVTGEEKKLRWYKWITLGGAAMWIITSGLLSHKVATGLETPFRNVSMSMTLGAYSRFESIISVALTFGWFGFSSLLLYCACKCFEGLKIKKEMGIWAIVILALTNQLINVKIPPEITVIYIIFAWILFPVFEMKKISKKSEKSA